MRPANKRILYASALFGFLFGAGIHLFNPAGYSFGSDPVSRFLGFVAHSVGAALLACAVLHVIRSESQSALRAGSYRVTAKRSFLASCAPYLFVGLLYLLSPDKSSAEIVLGWSIAPTVALGGLSGGYAVAQGVAAFRGASGAARLLAVPGLLLAAPMLLLALGVVSLLVGQVLEGFLIELTG